MPLSCDCGLPGAFRDFSSNQPFAGYIVAQRDDDLLRTKIVEAGKILGDPQIDWDRAEPQLLELLGLERMPIQSRDRAEVMQRIVSVLNWQMRRMMYQCPACKRVWIHEEPA